MATYEFDPSDDSSSTSDEDQSDESSEIADDLKKIQLSDDEKIIQMYETVLNHSGNWERAKTTHIVCKIAGEDSPIKITNDPKGA